MESREQVQRTYRSIRKCRHNAVEPESQKSDKNGNANHDAAIAEKGSLNRTPVK